MSLRPIITICGTTGVGKSKLAVDLALHIARNRPGWRSAKIINADAMQVYKGLDIITNKIPEVEQHGVPHLLMGFKQPGDQYVVGEWVRDSIRLIDEMHKDNILPIVVGGTAYWIQHLIFPDRLETSSPTLTSVPPHSDTRWPPDLACVIASLPEELKEIFDDLPSESPIAKANPDYAFKMYTLLSMLDPPVAQRWHWRDTRKVLRNLQILKDSKMRPSDIIRKQSNAYAEHGPRYRSLVLWLFSEPLALEPRLNSRVDDMISMGLLDEMRTLQDIASQNLTGTEKDFTLGIYQSIGYREFATYLDNPHEKGLKEATERMKISTRQYAKRQISWIRNKLIPAVDATNRKDALVPLYLLDATVLGDGWSQNVQSPAITLVDGFLKGNELPDPKSLSDRASTMLDVVGKDVDPGSVLQARKKLVCTTCTTHTDRPVLIEEGAEWAAHTKTRSHRRLAQKKDTVPGITC